MTPAEFKSAWLQHNNNLCPVSLNTLDRFPLTASAKDFLHISGLPEDAAPFLSFFSDTTPEEKYSSISRLTDWFDFLPADFSHYVVIGADGGGNIIALNTDAECIVEWLDHEDNFEAEYMNASILQLAASLLAYQQFVKAVQKENGDDMGAYINGKFSDTSLEILEDMLYNIDERAVSEGFWYTELRSLLALRNGNI